MAFVSRVIAGLKFSWNSIVLYASYPFSNLALIGCFALLLNMVLGGPASLYAPVAFMHPLNLWEKSAQFFSEKLNRSRRSQNTRRFRGLLLVLFCLGLMIALGIKLTDIFKIRYGEYAEIMMLSIMLSARRFYDWSRQIEKLLPHAPHAISTELLPVRMMRRQQKEYDIPTVLRGTVENMMVELAEGVIAPLFYYIIAGWPGLLAVSAVSVLDRLIGYRNPQYADFGAAAAGAHTLLQWIPSRLTGLLIFIAACFAPGCSPAAALRIMLTQAGKTVSNNAGWPIGAAAGALKVTLGGPRAMLGSYIADQWIGEGSVQPDVRMLKAARALFLTVILLVLMGLLLAAAA